MKTDKVISLLGENFNRQHFEIFSYFPQKVDFNISCKLSLSETTGMRKTLSILFCINVKVYFLGKERKILSI